MRAPPGVQILSISCSFWEHLAKSYVDAPPGELAPPPRGNPGSATGTLRKFLTRGKFLTSSPEFPVVPLTDNHHNNGEHQTNNRNRPNRGPELYNNVEYGNLLIQKRNAFQIKKKHTQPD